MSASDSDSASCHSDLDNGNACGVSLPKNKGKRGRNNAARAAASASPKPSAPQEGGGGSVTSEDPPQIEMSAKSKQNVLVETRKFTCEKIIDSKGLEGDGYKDTYIISVTLRKNMSAQKADQIECIEDGDDEYEEATDFTEDSLEKVDFQGLEPNDDILVVIENKNSKKRYSRSFVESELMSIAKVTEKTFGCNDAYLMLGISMFDETSKYFRLKQYKFSNIVSDDQTVMSKICMVFDHSYSVCRRTDYELEIPEVHCKMSVRVYKMLRDTHNTIYGVPDDDPDCKADASFLEEHGGIIGYIQSLSDPISQVKTFSTKIQEFTTEIANLKAKLTAAEAINAQVPTLKTNLTSAEGKISAAEGKISTAESKITALEVEIASLKAKLISADTKTAAVDARLVALEAIVKPLPAKVTALEVLPAKVTALEVIPAKITAIEAKLPK